MVVHSIGSYLSLTGAAPETPADRFDRAYTENLLRRGVLDEAELFRTYERLEGRKTPAGDLFRMAWTLLRSGRLHTGPFAHRTRGWRRMREVLLERLAADDARRHVPRGAPGSGPGGPR